MLPVQKRGEGHKARSLRRCSDASEVFSTVEGCFVIGFDAFLHERCKSSFSWFSRNNNKFFVSADYNVSTTDITNIVLKRLKGVFFYMLRYSLGGYKD